MTKMAKVSKKQPLTWQTVNRKVDDLLPLTFNPRKISPEQEQKLMQSIQKFNLAEIPIINFDNSIIGGNQRIKALKMLGRGKEIIDVRYPSRQLSELELKQYVLTSNTHAGDWDFDILELEFSDINLDEFNIELPNLDEIQDDFNEEKPKSNAKVPEMTKKWIVYIDCITEKGAEKMYGELSGRGFETKIVN